MKGIKSYTIAQSIHHRLYNLSAQENVEFLYKDYLRLIRRAAYLGVPDAQYALAQQYEDIGYLGIPNPMHNPKKCIFWYTKACENNHAEACNNLAALYETGIGCIQNLNTALSLYKKSAELGYKTGKKNYKKMLRDLSKGGMYNR